MAVNNIGNSSTQTPLPAAPQGAPAPVVAKAAVAVPEPAPQHQPSNEQVRKAMDSIKQLVEAKAPNSLSFSVDNTTGKAIVKITDVKTGEMIRQIPSEEMLEIARSIDKMQGMLLRQEA